MSVGSDIVNTYRVDAVIVKYKYIRRFMMYKCGNILMVGAMLIPLLGLFSCSSDNSDPQQDEDPDWAAERETMIRQLQQYGITNRCVLETMGKVRRHMFIPEDFRSRATAYGDHPYTIGHGQTISQPYIVAYMTERLNLKPGEKVLEIGTGSGYQAAVLAECGMEVYSIEIIPELAEHARVALEAEGYGDVHVLTGDGYKGWPEHSPFDAIIVTCAPEAVPQALKDQLAEGGRMIIPVGKGVQRLVILRKEDGQIHKHDDLPVRFVPMVPGEKEEED